MQHFQQQIWLVYIHIHERLRASNTLMYWRLWAAQEYVCKTVFQETVVDIRNVVLLQVSQFDDQKE